MEAEKIRLRGAICSCDKLNCPLAEHLGDIALPLNWGLALVEVRRAAVTTVRVIAGIAAHDAEELVIPALQWTVAGQIAEMPFSDQRRPVAGIPQRAGQSGVIRRDAHLRRVAITPPQRFDKPDRQAVLVTPGDQ